MKICKRIFSPILLVIFVFGFVACDKKSSTGNEDGLLPPPVGFRAFYQIWRNLNDSFFAYGEIMGNDSETYPGETYTKIQVGNFSEQGNEGFIAWLDFSTPQQVGFKAAETYREFGAQKSSGVVDNDWYMLEVFDTPLYISYDCEVGETQVAQANATYYFSGDMNNFSRVDMSVAVTYTSASATIEVPHGTYDDAIRLDAVFTETITQSTNRLLKSESWEGTFYLHSILGVLSAMPVPGFYKVQLAADED